MTFANVHSVMKQVKWCSVLHTSVVAGEDLLTQFFTLRNDYNSLFVSGDGTSELVRVCIYAMTENNLTKKSTCAFEMTFIFV